MLVQIFVTSDDAVLSIATIRIRARFLAGSSGAVRHTPHGEKRTGELPCPPAVAGAAVA